MPLEKGVIVVVEGLTGSRPRAMVVQGRDARNRWKLKLIGGRGRSLAGQEHGARVWVEGEPYLVTGHNATHVRLESCFREEAG